MRILLTVHQFFPQYRAGTEVLTFSVAKQLISLGHQVHVFTGFPGESDLSDDERFDEYEYENIHVYRFHHAYKPMAGQQSMIEVGYCNKLALKHFEAIVQSYRPNLIHHFHLNRLGIGLINHAYDKNIPQYFTPTDFWMICPTAQLMLGEGKYCSGPDLNSGNCIQHFARDKKTGLGRMLVNSTPTLFFKQLSKFTKNHPLIHYPMSNEVRALATRTENVVEALNKLDKIFAPNPFIKNLFLRYGVKEELLVEQAFGIDLEKHVSSNKSHRPKGGEVVVGFIGTLAPHKGCHIVIDAVKKLNSKSVKLEIYGNPDDFPEYVLKLERLAGLSEKIIFKGTFPNEDINTIMSNFDVLVVPSVWYENTPLVIYSAQAAKCPVIGSDLPGVSAAVKHGFNGLLFKPGDVDDLVDKLKLFIKNKQAGFVYSTIVPLSTEEYVNALISGWMKSH
ncbi:glycosyltransferase [Pantoea sp. KPR_PJ]|uniref:glycosyltransferase n=1 Tax=Pantoea sp. KPR_PJ TaxID=2738375 RepID=UPI0035278650